MGRMPNVYRQPWGAPLRWQDDETGVLPKAVKAFFQQEPMDASQVEMIRDYCEYYINAPGWQTQTMAPQFASLRARVKHLTTTQEILVWLEDSLAVGIDPF